MYKFRLLLICSIDLKYLIMYHAENLIHCCEENSINATIIKTMQHIYTNIYSIVAGGKQVFRISMGIK